MLMLSSYQRLLRYCATPGGDALVDTPANRRDLTTWIPAVSAQLEGYCNRLFEITSRTEYYKMGYAQIEFFVRANPVVSLTSVYDDPTGKFTGDEGVISDCYIGVDANTIVMPNGLAYTGPRSVRIIYTGGLAYHGTNSVYNITSKIGTFTLGYLAFGATSGALGIIRAVTSTTIALEIIYGRFSPSETISIYSSENLKGEAFGTAVLDSAVSLSLAEAYPDIVRAAEMQIRYCWSRKMSFENTNASKDNNSRRTSNLDVNDLQPEVSAILDGYRRAML